MKRLMNYIGIDPAIGFTLAGRIWGLVSGVVSLLLIASFLTPLQQGYYYTFASLIAMQILFELGMGSVIVQFASHEMAHLSWLKSGVVSGDIVAKSRLGSLVLLMVKWYGAVSLVMCLVVLPVGWLFLSEVEASDISWKMAWLWLVLATAANIFFIPFLSVLEGCGRIREVAKIRMYQYFIGNLGAWTVLMLDGGLLALPVMSTILVSTILFWLFSHQRFFFFDLMASYDGKEQIKWLDEVWPFQWRIAVSWLSGYFIFQLFTPILFRYRGAVEAGQLGMSFSIANALMGIAIAWINTKAPSFGSLIAKKNYAKLDEVFRITFMQSLGVIFFLGFCLILLNGILNLFDFKFVSRILAPLPFAILIFATMLAFITYAQATYLRAHKKEPFMLISVISAVIIGSLAIPVGKFYGGIGLMFLYAGVYAVVGVGWGSLIFFSKKREWQSNC